MKKISLIFIALLWVAGCASTPKPESMANAELENRDELVCKMEKPTGSNLPKRVCRYRSDIERGDDSAERLARKTQDRVRHVETRPH
ncbi:MAG: hypothetical protein OEV41_13200 [Gammaproteobacteria bacterium]|nr:hypothetical protein [Gammaproteobacteria bacterium]